MNKSTLFGIHQVDISVAKRFRGNYRATIVKRPSPRLYIAEWLLGENESKENPINEIKISISIIIL